MHGIARRGDVLWLLLQNKIHIQIISSQMTTMILCLIFTGNWNALSWVFQDWCYSVGKYLFSLTMVYGAKILFSLIVVTYLLASWFLNHTSSRRKWTKLFWMVAFIQLYFTHLLWIKVPLSQFISLLFYLSVPIHVLSCKRS